jgi:hypothetical protein
VGTDRAAAARKQAVDQLLSKLASARWCTLGALFAEAGADLDRATVRALSRGAAVLARNVTAVPRSELEAVHVAARDAVEAALQSDEVLLGLLRRLARTGRTRAHTVTELTDAVAARDRPALRAALKDRVRDRRWPEGVGAVAGRRSVLVFLLEDVIGAPSGGTPASFAEAFDEAFDRLRSDRGLNLVALSSLRAALGGYPRAAFDRELTELRRANRVVLHTFDGRHGKLRPEEEAAAIDEGGRRFVYAARREA